jgi:glycosyltransferase involved in cell wall biosynthesis
MFSIIIPLYNKSEFICRAIDSVLNQSFKEFEIIIVNDGSSDGSEKIVEENYGLNIKLIHQENQGVSKARNIGIAEAKFQYIAFLDADDYWKSDYLLIAQNLIKNSNYPGILGTAYTRFKEKQNILNSNDSFEKLEPFQGLKIYSISDFFKQALNSTLMFTSSVILKRDFFLKNDGFDPTLRFGEDLDVWFRAILYYGKFVHNPIELVYYSREDLSGATKQQYRLDQTYIPKIIKENYFNWEFIKEQEDISAFDRFKIKWVYLRLFRNYLNKENKNLIEDLIKKLDKKFLLIGWIYLLPFDFLNWFFSKKVFAKLWAKYLDFCLDRVDV